MRRGIIGLESAVDAVPVGNTKRATSLHGRYPESELRIFVPDKSDAVAVWRPLWRESGDQDGVTSRNRGVPGVSSRGAPPPAGTMNMSSLSLRSSFGSRGSETNAMDLPSGDHCRLDPAISANGRTSRLSMSA